MQYPTLSEYFAEAQRIIKAQKGNGEYEFSTGLTWVDEITGGMKRGEIWIVSGKTGCGKTAMALQMARNFCDDTRHSILFLSLELKGWQMALRMFCEVNGIDCSDLSNNRIEFDPRLVAGFEKYLDSIDFDIFEGGYNFEEVESVIKNCYEVKRPDIIFLDFVQLIEWKKFKDERIAIMEYIRKIKEWANKFNIGFVVISQIRRLPSGSDYSRAPDLQDLMGSGSLEQLADKVLFIYKTITTETIKGISSTVEKHFINIAKNRQGRTLEKEVIYQGASYHFKELIGQKPSC
jgi:replicative DNA helicase